MKAEQLLDDVVEHINETGTEKGIGHWEYNRFLELLAGWVESEKWQQEHVGPLFDDDG